MGASQTVPRPARRGSSITWSSQPTLTSCCRSWPRPDEAAQTAQRCCQNSRAPCGALCRGQLTAGLPSGDGGGVLGGDAHRGFLARRRTDMLGLAQQAPGFQRVARPVFAAQEARHGACLKVAGRCERGAAGLGFVAQAIGLDLCFQFWLGHTSRYLTCIIRKSRKWPDRPAIVPRTTCFEGESLQIKDFGPPTRLENTVDSAAVPPFAHNPDHECSHLAAST